MMRRTTTKSLPPLFASLCLTLSACGGSDQTGGSPVATQQASLDAPVPFLIVYRREAVPSNAAAEITKAGGTLVASYPEIGVVVASSASDTFASTMEKNPQVDGAAPTRGWATNAFPSKFADRWLPPPPPPATSGEPLAAMQWNMQNIHALQAQQITPGKKSVVVGVIDSGIDDSLPDLQGQVDHSKSVTCIGGAANTDPSVWSFDGIGHGSHVAGIIAANGSNGKGIYGVAPGVSLAAIKVSDDGFVYPEAVVCGLMWGATHGVDVFNASIFTDPWYYNCPNDAVQGTILKAQQRAVSFAARKNIAVIAAASNEQQDLANPTMDPFSPTDGSSNPHAVTKQCKVLPVGLDSVIGVSALAGDNNLSYYSNYGLGTIDLAAPGGDFHVPMPGNDSGQIVSTVPAYSFYYQVANNWNGRVGINCTDGLDPNDPNADPSTCAETYALLQGTSQAAPHVTGVAALAISRFGRMPPAVLQAVLSRGAAAKACPANPYQPFPSDMSADTCQGGKGYNGFYGAGEVDALATLR